MTEEYLRIGDYELEVGRLLERLASAGASRVLLQLPEGLKRYYPAVADYIGARTGVEVRLDAGPVYGSCLAAHERPGGYDLVVHVGHDPYPLYAPRGAKVVYLDLEYVGVDPEEFSGRVEEYLRVAGTRRVAIVTTNQHKRLSGFLRERLETGGFGVAFGPAVVFGCYVPPELATAGAEAVVVVAGGLFHAIGVGMLVGRTLVVRADPYTRTVGDASREVSRFVAVRLRRMLDALSARSWGIIVGTAGQYRPSVVERLVRVLRERGHRYYLYDAPLLDVEVLRNADSPEVEAYVVTSCPRVAVDDLSEFEKPVLTPSEALVVLERGSVDEYPRGFL